MSWHPPFRITPTAAPGGSLTTVARKPDHVDLFWVGFGEAVFSTWWDLPATRDRWARPFSITPQRAGESHAITSVARNAGRVDVFWISTEGAIAWTWWDASANQGRGAQSFLISNRGAAEPGAITCVARKSSHIDVFWITPDGAVAATWWEAGQQRWVPTFEIAPRGPLNRARSPP